MRAMLANQPVLSLLVAVNNQFFPQNFDWPDGFLFGKLASGRNRVPIAPQQLSARCATPDAG
jgi:hypothetical protein